MMSLQKLGYTIRESKKNGFSSPYFLVRKSMLNPILFNEPNRMYPIRIEYVFKADHDSNDPIFRKIVEYCALLKIKLLIRQYNPKFIDEDRENILRLPALQIYEYHEYTNTYYVDDKPIVHIRNLFEKFELKHLEYLSKKQIWDEKLSFMKRIFKKETLKTDSSDTTVSNVLQNVNNNQANLRASEVFGRSS